MTATYCFLMGPFLAACAAAESAAQAVSSTDAPWAAFKPAGAEFRFDTGVLQGTLRQGGKSLGFRPVLEGAPGTPVAGAFGLLSPYRMLTSDARFGSAAWDWASQAQLLPNGGVEMKWAADKDHPLDMTLVYRISGRTVLDVAATIKPRQDLRRFELFLASYFQGFPATFAYVRECAAAGGKPGFLEATKAAGDWQMFLRDDEAAQIIGDGRWKRAPNPVDWKIMPRLAAPVALRRDAKSGLAAVLMTPPDDCFAISMPYGEEGHRSVYLSLFGRDVKAGESATARARLVFRRELSDQQAVELYENYAKKQ
jgi:hypothetical protein